MERKFVLVTGAFGGMGEKVVRQLLDGGYSVIALDKNVKESSKNVYPIEVDITDEQSVISAFERVNEITKSLYAIVHFAGIYMLDSLVEISLNDFERIVKCNFFGAFLINKSFLPLLKNGSKILITTSELAPLDPLPFTGLYAVTKSALDKYAYSLRMELQLLGISVSVLRAGAVDTGMIDVSTTALDKFCKETKIYTCNAKRFKSIVDRVEARKIAPEKIAKKVEKILGKKHSKFAYKINRNPLLLLLNLMPQRFQFWVIKKILK
ncbi:MAG: SDR family NAD(P)-dependent oxidoreductase [Clostridia bacterium]|nr:SDR family NAD(P)-dependent oxidoreductase [Clostridia bacterium]